MDDNILCHYSPDYYVAPEELLSDVLSERSIATQDLFRKMFYAETEKMAEILETVLRIPKSFWVNAEYNYQEKRY